MTRFLAKSCTSLLVVFCLVPCQTVSQSLDYFPLNIGDFWRYAAYTGEGSFIGYWQAQTTGHDTIESIEYFVIERGIDNPTRTFYRKDTVDSQVRVWQYVPSHDGEVLKYKFPALPGETWDFGETGGTVTVWDTGSVVAGCSLSFRTFYGCYEFWYTLGYGGWMETLADSVGLIMYHGEGGGADVLVGAAVGGVIFGDITSVMPNRDRIRREPSMFRLRTWPNPFRGKTELTFHLSDDTTVWLEVFNVLGRSVRKTNLGMFSAGNHVVRWNGTDDHSIRVQPGVYICRLRTSCLEATVKVLLLE